MKGKCSNCKVCKAYLKEAGRGRTRQVLSVCWQRNVNDRRRSKNNLTMTGNDIRNAVNNLKITLAPLGVEVVLEIFTSAAAVLPREGSPTDSLWICGRKIDDWMTAPGEENGPFPDDRINIVKKTATGTITAESIVNVGLLAAKHLLQTAAADDGCSVFS